MHDLSKVSKASTNSKSVRATIPENIAAELKINAGSLLVWTIEQRKGKKIIVVEKWEHS